MEGYLEYHGGYSVLWGIHDARGGYHEYRKSVQYYGEYHLCNLSTVGGGNHDTCGDIMIHVGDIMSIVGGVQYRTGT